MPTTILRRLAVGTLLSVVWLGNAPAWAQVAVEPQALSVTVPQYATATHNVMLTNTGSAPLSFCVSFDRPLQRAEGESRLAESAAGGAPCGDYGEVLHYFDEDDLGGGWGPTAITMTPEGRLFTSETGNPHHTHEFTPDLELVRSFEHPTVAELEPFPATPGVGYDTESGTLWWVNEERRNINGQDFTLRVLLLEGDLNGVETGRRIALAPPEGPIGNFSASGLAYEPATDLFFFSGQNGEPEMRRLWAVDRTGALAEGYPLRPEPYPPPALTSRPDVHGGSEGGPEGVRIEYAVYPTANAPGYDRVALVDRWGNAQGEELETPMPAVLFEDGGYGARASLRSRVDPNGVMYVTFTSFEHTGIVGVRPHPLPPSWLVVDSDAGPEAAWDGTLAPGESRTLALTFRAGPREIGVYTSSLQVFEAESGEAVEVPLTLTVTQGTDAEEEEAAPAEASSLAVYPNPSAGAATVVLTLPRKAEVRLSVYDVLGRRVAVLHAGPLPAGAHRFTLDSAGLPAGVYVVQATGDTFGAVRRVTLVR